MNLRLVGAYWRIVVGVGLVAAVPLLLIGDRLIARSEGDAIGGEIARIAAGSPQQWLAGSLLFLLGLVLLLPAVLGLVQLARTRGVLLANLGGTLAVLGVVGFVGLNALNYVLYQFAVTLEQEQMIEFAGGMNGNPGFAVIMSLVMFGFYPGLALLAVGLWRESSVPVWVAACLLLGVSVLFLGSGGIFNVVGFGVMAFGLGWTGIRVLGSSGNTWAGVDSASNRAEQDGPRTVSA
ncbi:MAG TPA: hypothetical protein VF168_05095 [Trueperaceae bacterium]